MRCGACGHGNRETAAFCESCGSRLAPRCSRCAAELRPGARFCDACGQAQATAASPTATPTPQSHTPRHLAAKILAGRDALAGERKQVTVLFADVVGSTELIQGRDAEEAQALLDGVVQVMMDAVHRYEGTVSRLMGDGLMAMFGAPVAHEDHAVRACYAALAMVDGVRRHGESARRAYGITPTIRVGLSAGEVVVRTIRDDLHMDYTAMGQTVHLASRMEQLAAPSTAALTAETLALVEGYVQVRSLGLVPIKGLPEPVEAFELTGLGHARTRLHVAEARGLTRFVGRDLEMAALHAALTRAGSGQGQVAALVGEPGVGKSRLVREVTDAHRAHGWTVLEVGAVSAVYPDAGGGTTTPYLPVVNLLKSYCRIDPSDDHDAIREKIGSKVRGLGEELLPTVPAFLALLDVATGDDAWEALDPTQRRRQTLDAVKRLLLRESQKQPLLLVFEDLHWIDSESQAVLDSLVESLPTARMMLLVNFRPEYTHAWGSRSCYTQLRIDPLGQQSAEELLDGLLGKDATLEPLRALLTKRTEGNPLFLEESVRALVETGLLIGERGAYRLSRPVVEVRVPATVQAVLAARIDRLPPDAKQLLQTAAVIGKDVPDALLRAVADHGDEGLQRGLAVLQAAEFLYEASLFSELEYTFKHALTHEVAYGSLLQERRKTIHGRVLDALERLHPDRLDEYVERLAQHALSSERWERAVAYLHQAGQKALERTAYPVAVAHFERALFLISRLPDGRDTLELAADLHYGAFFALRRGMGVNCSLGHLREAERLAETLDDQPRLGRVVLSTAECHYYLGDHQPAAEMARRALALGEALGDRFLRVQSRSILACCYRSTGEYRRAVDAVTPADVEISGDSGSLPVYVAPTSKRELSWSLWELGDFAEASRHIADGLQLAERSGSPDWVAFACQGLGFLQLRRGWVDQAIEALERSLHLCETLGLASLFSGTASQLGAAYVLVGRASEGLPLIERAEQQATEIGRTGEIAFRGIALSGAHLALGHRDQALELAHQAVRSAALRKERGDEAYALLLLGEIAASGESPDADETEARYREALALSEELEMRPLQAHCHLGLGKLYRRIGRVDEARAELATAISRLREMEMTFWLPEAEAELTELATAPAPAEHVG